MPLYKLSHTMIKLFALLLSFLTLQSAPDVGFTPRLARDQALCEAPCATSESVTVGVDTEGTSMVESRDRAPGVSGVPVAQVSHHVSIVPVGDTVTLSVDILRYVPVARTVTPPRYVPVGKVSQPGLTPVAAIGGIVPAIVQDVPARTRSR